MKKTSTTIIAVIILLAAGLSIYFYYTKQPTLGDTSAIIPPDYLSNGYIVPRSTTAIMGSSTVNSTWNTATTTNFCFSGSGLCYTSMAAGTQTPWAQNINANGYDLANVKNASTTLLTVSGTAYINQLCLTGDTCRTTWPSGGSEGGVGNGWATTTNNLILYPSTTSHIVTIGSNATTSNNSIFEVSGVSKFTGDMEGIGSSSVAKVQQNVYRPWSFSSIGSIPYQEGSTPLLAIVGNYVYLYGSDSNHIMKASTTNMAYWVDTGKTLPIRTWAAQIIIINSTIYILGGSSGNPTNTIFTAPLSDPTTVTNTGKTIAVAEADAQVLIDGDYVYLLGGETGAGTYSNSIQRAPLTNPLAWSDTGVTLPSPLANSQVVTIGNHHYLLGGNNDNMVSAHIYQANIGDASHWKDLGIYLPAPLYNSVALVVNSDICLFGGYASSTSVNNIYCSTLSDPPVNWVDTGYTLPTVNYNASGIYLDDNIYIIGGQSISLTYDTVWQAGVQGASEQNKFWKYAPLTSRVRNAAYGIGGSGSGSGDMLKSTYDTDTNSIIDIGSGGTGLGTAPTYGQVLVGTAGGIYALQATSTLGLGSGGGGSGTVNSGTQYQAAYYATAGTAVSGTSTITFASTGSVTLGSGTEGLRVLSTNGYVGIGTTTPAYQVDVYGNSRIDGTLTIGAYTLPKTDGTNGYVLKTNGSGTLTWQADNNSGGGGGSTAYLGSIGDVSTSSLAYGSVIRYNTATAKWESVATSTLKIALSDTTGVLGIAQGGLNLSSVPSYGQIPVGNGTGYTLTATSSLGITSGGGSGTVNSGTANQVAYYASSASTVSGTSTVSIGSDSSLTLGVGTEGLRVLSTNGYVGVSSTSPFSVFSVGTGPGLGVSSAGTIVYGTWNATAISMQYGGTGQDFSTLAGGSLFYTTSKGLFAGLASSTYGQILWMDANGRPAWVATSSINLSLSNTYGTLGISQGGTNITSYAGGDMLYASAANTLAKLASSTGGSDLQISSSGYPTWVADPNTMRFPIASTSWPTTGTTSPCFGLGPLLDATTFTKFSCQTDTGTLGLTIASSTAVTDFVFVIASTTAGSIAFPSAHKDFSVGQNPQVCIGGISGAPNQVHCNIDYHRDN